MVLLKEPVKAGNVVLHNRLVMPPMKTGKADADGGVTDELVTYYAERARGGAIGLVITEHHYVREDGIASLNQVSAAKDADIPGLARIAEAVHGVLEKTPPELAADITVRGIVLTGGGALLDGLTELLEEKTGINTMVAENPADCVALGTGMYLELMDRLGRIDY